MKQEISFETALKRLEEIVSLLEKGNTDLDNSLKLFEEGVALVKLCDSKLKEVEVKTAKILENETLKDFKEED
jgi:exodeoxyribonuclease VII small subunit